MFNSLSPQVVLQEVPGEISLQLTITGCKLGCDGCHSPEIHDHKQGSPLTSSIFSKLIEDYVGYVTCILFFGGEWQAKKLTSLLIIAKEHGFKTCLYTGKNNLPNHLLAQLDFVKYGKWQAELGGLDSRTTNQRFVELKTGNLLNHRFLRRII